MNATRMERLQQIATARGYSMSQAVRPHTAGCDHCNQIPAIGEWYVRTLHGSRVGSPWPAKLCLPCFDTYCVRQGEIAANDP